MALTDDQLDLLDRTQEVKIETLSPDGPVKTIIWIVVEDGDVYVRSVRGASGKWYRRVLSNPLVAIHADGERIEFRAVGVDEGNVIETVSSALRDKYPPGGSLDRMTDASVLDTTLRLEPISS